MNNQDIELIREAADIVEWDGKLEKAAHLRSLADRMEAQSNAEPVGIFWIEDGAYIHASDFHKGDSNFIPLFTHADAGEVERLKAEAVTARTTGNHWKMELVEANKVITTLESQLSAIRQAAMDDNPSRMQREIKRILNTIAPEKQQEGMK